MSSCYDLWSIWGRKYGYKKFNMCCSVLHIWSRRLWVASIIHLPAQTIDEFVYGLQCLCKKLIHLSLYQTHLVFITIHIYCAATVSLLYSLQMYIILQNLKILHQWLLQMIFKVYMISKDKEMVIVCTE